MRRTIFGEILVTLFILAVGYAVLKPVVNQFKWRMRYGKEMDRMHKLFGAVSMYAGSNDDRFPSSISNYDHYLLSNRQAPTDSIATNYWWLPSTCSVLNEFAGGEICSSPNDLLPKSAQPSDKTFVSWKHMTGSSYHTSSRFGIYHVALSSTWNCPTMPMFWTQPFEGSEDDPIRVTYFEGETKLVPAEEFGAQTGCIKATIAE